MNPDSPTPPDLEVELEAELEAWLQSNAATPLRQALEATPPLPGEEGLADRLIQARQRQNKTADRSNSVDHPATNWAAQERQLRRWKIATGISLLVAFCALALLLVPLVSSTAKRPAVASVPTTAPIETANPSTRPTPRPTPKTTPTTAVLASHSGSKAHVAKPTLSGAFNRLVKTRASMNRLHSRPRTLSALSSIPTSQQTRKPKASL